MSRNRSRKKNKKRKSSNVRFNQPAASKSSDLDKELDRSLVSIIMTAYNSEDTLGRAVNSILAQTYTNFELIIIDDCSTDSTLEVAKSFISDKVRVIKSSINSGTYFCKNHGMRRARGRYITFHDADDWCDPNHIELLHKAYWELKDTDIWVGHPTMESPRNKAKIVFAGAKVWANVDGELKSIEQDYILRKWGTNRGHLCRHKASITSFFEADLLQSFGGFDSVRFGADSEFSERVGLFYGKQETHIPQWRETYHRYDGEGSLTRSQSTGMHSPVRRSYKISYRRWHMDLMAMRAICKPELLYLLSPFMDFPLLKRKFAIKKPNEGIVPESYSEDCFQEIFKD